MRILVHCLLVILLGIFLYSPPHYAVAATHTPLEVQRLRAKNSICNKHVTIKKTNYVTSGKIKNTQHLYHAIKHRRHDNAADTLYSGSLKANIIRLAHDRGWNHVVWQPDFDFNWLGTTRIAANNLPTLLNKVLNGYPLQATFYNGNHVLLITTR